MKIIAADTCATFVVYLHLFQWQKKENEWEGGEEKVEGRKTIRIELK